MDFARLTEALASKSYEKMADICDDLMLQAINFLFSLRFVFNLFVFHESPKPWPDLSSGRLFNFPFHEQAAAEGIAYQDEWPYTIHILGYLYVDDM